MYADRFGLEYIQLHGKESPEYCQSLRTSGLKIIKAFSVLPGISEMSSPDFDLIVFSCLKVNL